MIAVDRVPIWGPPESDPASCAMDFAIRASRLVDYRRSCSSSRAVTLILDSQTRIDPLLNGTAGMRWEMAPVAIFVESTSR
jgi:hypothetical protein